MVHSNARRRDVWPLAALLFIGACSTEQAPVASELDSCTNQPTLVSAEFRLVYPDSTRVRVGEITRASVGQSGELFVLDGTGPLLFRVDSTGGVRVLVSRKGRGPGELLDPRAFAIGPTGEIAVLTPDPPQIALFDSTGRFLRALRYWRAAMATDAAFDADGHLYVSYRGLRLSERLRGGERFATVERLLLGDSIVEQPVSELDSATVNGHPYFSAPIIETFLASSPSGQIAATGNLLYDMLLIGHDAELFKVRGCTDGVENSERLKQSSLLEGGYTLLGAELAYAPDGTLFRLTPSIRKSDGYQRLDRWSSKGVLMSSWLLPSASTGGHYLTAVLPTQDSTRLWGYEAGGELYTIRVGPRASPK
jgi:hypothetical protein